MVSLFAGTCANEMQESESGMLIFVMCIGMRESSFLCVHPDAI